MPPSKVPAPDTGTGGGAHATSGAMSSVPLRARPNDASSSTRLTRAVGDDGAFGERHRQSAEYGVAAVECQFTPGRAAVRLVIAHAGPNAGGGQRAAGAEEPRHVPVGEVSGNIADVHVDATGAIDVVHVEIAQDEPADVEPPRRHRRRQARGWWQVDPARRVRRTSSTRPSSTCSDDSRTVPPKTAHGSDADTRRAVKNGASAWPGAESRTPVRATRRVSRLYSTAVEVRSSFQAAATRASSHDCTRAVARGVCATASRIETSATSAASGQTIRPGILSPTTPSYCPASRPRSPSIGRPLRLP